MGHQKGYHEMQICILGCMVLKYEYIYGFWDRACSNIKSGSMFLLLGIMLVLVDHLLSVFGGNGKHITRDNVVS